jgi:hypothetical protein
MALIALLVRLATVLAYGDLERGAPLRKWPIPLCLGRLLHWITSSIFKAREEALCNSHKLFSVPADRDYSPMFVGELRAIFLYSYHLQRVFSIIQSYR